MRDLILPLIDPDADQNVLDPLDSLKKLQSAPSRLNEHDAQLLVDRLQQTIMTRLEAPPWSPRRIGIGQALQSVQQMQGLGVAHWRDSAATLDGLCAQLGLIQGNLRDAALALKRALERPYTIKNQVLLSRLIVLAARLCLSANDQQAAIAWLHWGLAYFRFRADRAWLEIADCLLRFIPREACHVERRRWPALERSLIRLRRFALYLEMDCMLPLPRSLKRRAAEWIRWASRAAYRSRPGLGLAAWGWNQPLAPPVDSLTRIDGSSESTSSAFPVESRGNAGVLVTRAMGGIGDLLMMTPGLHALAQSMPRRRITFAVPGRYVALFEGNPDFDVIDIESGEIDLSRYSNWINLTACPAAAVEAATVPRVRSNRIDVFALAMGLDGRAVRAMDHRPRYFMTEREIAFRREFWRKHELTGQTVIGVQLKAQDSYKDFPGMMEVARRLAERYAVILMHDRKPADWDTELTRGMFDAFGLPLRDAIAVASGCDVLVTPDSSFLHVSAAIGVACVALFGPTDGKLFSRYYDDATYLDCRESLRCLPCWRNQYTSCHLSGGRESICMRMLPVAAVVDAVESRLAGIGKKPADGDERGDEERYAKSA